MQGSANELGTFKDMTCNPKVQRMGSVSPQPLTLTASHAHVIDSLLSHSFDKYKSTDKQGIASTPDGSVSSSPGAFLMETQSWVMPMAWHPQMEIALCHSLSRRLRSQRENTGAGVE